MKLFVKLLLSFLLASSFLNASESNPTKEEVAKLYVATFNRAPDTIGLNYWINESFGGHPTLSNIAESFFDAPETQALYPQGTSNRNFVRSVYANLFNREPDTIGWNYWEAELNEQKYSKNLFIQTVINGAQDSADGQDATVLANKTRVGLSFSEAGLINVDDARAIMSGVSDDDASMTLAVNKFGISLYVMSPPASTHTFQEGLSLDISSGAIGNSIISLFKNDNSNIEMLFTLGKDKTATIQYVQNSEAIWQNTSYVYSIVGNTITCTLPVGGGLNIGQVSAPMQVTLVLGSSNVTAHVTATINTDAYTVFGAFGDKLEPIASGSWTATPLTAPIADLIISSDGQTIVGTSYSDFSLHTYNVLTQATTNLVTDSAGNALMCSYNSEGGRDIVQIDESKTKYAFVCTNPFGDDALGIWAHDRVYTYNATTNIYKAISLETLEKDAYRVFMNPDASKIMYQAWNGDDIGDTIFEYNTNNEATTTITNSRYGLKLLDVDTSLSTLVYMSTPYIGGYTHQQLVVAHNGVKEIVEDLTQDLTGSIQIIDARVSRDGGKIIYILGNLYDSARSSLVSLYMYDMATGTKTTLAENFSTTGIANHNTWGMSSYASTLVFSMNAPWGTETLESQAYIYTFNVASKTHNEIYKGYIEGILVSPDAAAIYAVDTSSLHLLRLSAQ